MDKQELHNTLAPIHLCIKYPVSYLFIYQSADVYDVRPQLMKLGLTSKFINRSQVIKHHNAHKEFLAFSTII